MVERKKYKTWMQQGKEVGGESLQNLVGLYDLEQSGLMENALLLL